MNACDECDVSGFNLEDPVLIPEPGKIRGCLISRDPTVKFPEPFADYKRIAATKGLLWFNAPPAWLCNRIRTFMGFDEDSRELTRIREFLDRGCYWTHLHKCPTCRTAATVDCPYGYHPFSRTRAARCADFWFTREFEEHRLGDKVIVTLGKDVKRYFSQWLFDHPEIDLSDVITLPHPSPANVGTGWSWNRNSADREFVEGEIGRLLERV